MATKFITVSIEIMHDKELNQSQKFILAEIEQLSQLDKGCFASNQHFSELIGITKENVSRNINDLQKKGYIDVEIVNGSRNHTRIIRVTTIVRPPYQNSKTPLLKQQETKENITSNKDDYASLKEMWNRYADVTGSSKVTAITSKRKLKIQSRLKDYSDFVKIFDTCLFKASRSDFLKKSTFFDFDWLILNDTNIIKVYEGKYDNNENDFKEVIL